MVREREWGRRVFGGSEGEIDGDGGIEWFMEVGGGVGVIEGGNGIDMEGRV